MPAVIYIWIVENGLENITEEYVSPQIENILGFRADEWMADPTLWFEHLHPDDRDEVVAETRRSVEGGEPFELEYRMIAKDGRVVWLHDVASVLARDGEGRTTRYQGVQLDITARKEAEHAYRGSVERIRHLHDQRRQLLRRLVTTQEEERRRIALDIHDDTIQKMVAIPMRLETVAMAHPGMREEEAYLTLVREVDDAIGRLRRLTFELHPPALEAQGLVAAIQTHMVGWQKRGSAVFFRIHNHLLTEPREATRSHLYRIIQEALNNAHRHSEATDVTLTLRSQAGGFTAVVEDDGVGFDVQAARSADGGHIGLSLMVERAEIAGGWCRVESRPGHTKVEAWVPERVPEDLPVRSDEAAPDDIGIPAERDIDQLLTSLRLTAREIEVAHMLAVGHTNAEIAASLYLSVRTIEHHRASVFRKLGVRSRSALVARMYERPAPAQD